jgi:hypothetical protein
MDETRTCVVSLYVTYALLMPSPCFCGSLSVHVVSLVLVTAGNAGMGLSSSYWALAITAYSVGFSGDGGCGRGGCMTGETRLLLYRSSMGLEKLAVSGSSQSLFMIFHEKKVQERETHR